MLARFEVHGNGDAITIVVTGDIDVSNAIEFRHVVSPELMRAPVSFVIDCRGIHSVDPAGLQVLLTIVAARRGTGSPCVLRGPSPLLVRLLETTGTKELFTIDPVVRQPPRCARHPREQSRRRSRSTTTRTSEQRRCSHAG